MPVLSGGEAVRSLQAFPETAQIPVAFVVGDASEPELIRALRAGAVDVIAKPITERIARRLRSVLGDLEVEDAGLTREQRMMRRLLALYRRDRREGTLLVNPGTPFEGRAEFEAGELEHAEYGPLSGEGALLEMLQIDEGRWRFETDPSKLSRKTPLPGSIPALPMLGPFAPRVLVVDDDPELRRLFQSQLTRAGMKVETAADGAEATEKAPRLGVDLVLADLHMPRMDGWEMLRRLKADHRTREVPVVFLSAADDFRETLAAARAGAHDYLSKTGRAEPVLQRLRLLLEPRFRALDTLREGKLTEVSLALLGPAWLLRTIEGLKLSGKLDVRDEWGRYLLQLEDGRLISAAAQVNPRRLDGYGALAALLVSHGAEGTFLPCQVEVADTFAVSTREALEKTAVVAQPDRGAPHRAEALVRRGLRRRRGALCALPPGRVGERHPRRPRDRRAEPRARGARRGARAPRRREVEEILKDLLRRGVIQIAAEA